MSVKNRILTYLQSGETLTALKALNLFSTMNLRNRVSELRAEGYNIQDRTIHDKQTGKHYSEYFLSDRPVRTEQEEAVAANNLAQEEVINFKEVNKQMAFI